MKGNWNRFVMDITHHKGEHFLTIIDCGPFRFAIWWPLHQQDTPTVIRQLENVFFERCPSMKILTDNNTAFTSKEFGEFARNWDVHLRFRCAYSLSGNWIVERNHRTIKTIAVRKNCSILEAVYWHNVTPKDDVLPCTMPADALHRYHVRIKGVKDNLLRWLEGSMKKETWFGLKIHAASAQQNIALVMLLKWSAYSLWKLIGCLITLKTSDQ